MTDYPPEVAGLLARGAERDAGPAVLPRPAPAVAPIAAQAPQCSLINPAYSDRSRSITVENSTFDEIVTQPAVTRRRRLDGPLAATPAATAGRCAVCMRRYLRGARVTWLDGSGLAHVECAQPGQQTMLMRVASVLAAHAHDAAELRELLVMAGLISPHAARRARRARRPS